MQKLAPSCGFSFAHNRELMLKTSACMFPIQESRSSYLIFESCFITLILQYMYTFLVLYSYLELAKFFFTRSLTQVSTSVTSRLSHLIQLITRLTSSMIRNRSDCPKTHAC